jgi:predicted Rossmann fold flavoprotein
MDEYDIIITGAGPAGLFCAINCPQQKGRKILVLEKNPSPGRKLLLSGSGKCNITHTGTVNEFMKHYGRAGEFVKPALNSFTPASMIDFLRHNSIPVTEDENGKIFPESMKAGDVLSMMISLCEKNGVSFRYSSGITQTLYEDGNFKVSAGKKTYITPVLVITTGGQSYPSTGSTGDGYVFAQSMGHSIIRTSPALAPVLIRNFAFTSLSGNSIRNTCVSLHREGRKLHSSSGDVLFTHRGLSGPVILDMSRHIEENDILKISLTGKSTGDMSSVFISESRDNGKKSIKSYLKRFDMSERLINEILLQQKIDPAKKVSEISRDERTALLKALGEYPFTVEKKGGFDIAMATYGGVCRGEINRFTMESKIIPGLYFAGEVIDVDGDTGGYNIQWAFSSGKLAADSIRQKFRD